jgi:carbamoyl-phosphate synthase large subunit
VRKLTVLLTAAGVPGCAALVRALRENGEREIRLVGTDMAELAVGRHLCDSFHVVPAGTEPGFVDALVEICRREEVDALVPQSSYELQALAEGQDRFGETAVLVSRPDAVRICNDKAATYDTLPRTPGHTVATSADELVRAAGELGYPDEDVAVKPRMSSGSRGFRIVSARADRRRQLLENRPGVAEALRLEELVELVGDEEMLVMEVATGRERTIDGIAEGGRIVLGHPKTREEMRAGLAMYFETLDDPALMELAAQIVAQLGLDHFFNIQLVGEHVIEVNPRISTIVYQEDLNIPYLGIKHALGEISGEELSTYAGRLRPARRALRYFDQIEWDASA